MYWASDGLVEIMLEKGIPLGRTGEPTRKGANGMNLDCLIFVEKTKTMAFILSCFLSSATSLQGMCPGPECNDEVFKKMSDCKG